VRTGAFVHAERTLVASLGLTQKAVRALRDEDLDRTLDWDTVSGEVRYSDAGREKLMSLLKISSEPAPALPAAAGAPPFEAAQAAPAPAPEALTAATHEDLVCHKRYKPNRHIVEALRATGELVLVRVKDNSNLQPGMTMKCRFGAGRVWELAQRLPRRRGRW
jgi:hypothetical protein